VPPEESPPLAAKAVEVEERLQERGLEHVARLDALPQAGSETQADEGQEPLTAAAQQEAEGLP
jgi:hypothetical protein